MPEATWEPHEKHGRLTTQSDLPDSVYAFPKQRKEPLTDAQHVRNAVARFDQVIDVSDADRALAFANIEKAANHYGVNLAETSWHDLGIHPQKKRKEAAAKGAVDARTPRAELRSHWPGLKWNLERRRNMEDTNAVIAVFGSHPAAEDAVKVARRFECHRRRSVQHRHTKRQHRDLRDRHKGGRVSGSCSWNFR